MYDEVDRRECDGSKYATKETSLCHFSKTMFGLFLLLVCVSQTALDRKSLAGLFEVIYGQYLWLMRVKACFHRVNFSSGLLLTTIFP